MASLNLPALFERLADAPQPGQWTEFGRERQVAFLEALATGGSVRSAARAADVSAQTVYRARRADAAFRLAWQGALLAARARAEDTLACRAIDGIEQEVLYHGEVVATRRRYSDRLLLAHLARLDRLTEDARTNAFAEDFEAALARFAAGEPQPDPVADPQADSTAGRAPGAGATPGAGIFSSGECHNRSRSYSERSERELEWCEHSGKMVTRFERLFFAMEHARPPGACQPHEFDGYYVGDVEAEQMEAFDQGIDRWWLVVPPGPDDDPGSWYFLDDDDDDGDEERDDEEGEENEGGGNAPKQRSGSGF